MRSITDRGYESPSPIQALSFRPITSGRDLLATAQTGTGKTAAFILPILEMLITTSQNVASETSLRPIRCLILAPTRELTEQIHKSTQKYSAHLPIRSASIYGGVSPRPQIETIQKGVDIVIATPGRLIDLLKQGFIELSHLQSFILDEADRMLDLGFINDIRYIRRSIPESVQTLLFSATLNSDIQNLSQDFLVEPEIIKVSEDNSTAHTVDQEVYRVDKTQKAQLLRKLLQREQWEQVLVFTRTKFGAEKLWTKLQDKNISSVSIHGDKSQAARQKALKLFKQQKVKVMVATDVAARGIDIQGLDHVVNFEMPNVPQDYIHRIGRTGRAGRRGHAVSFACQEEERFLRRIESLIQQDIPEKWDTDFRMSPQEAKIDQLPHLKKNPKKGNKKQNGTTNSPSSPSRNIPIGEPHASSSLEPHKLQGSNKKKPKKSKGKKVKVLNPMLKKKK